MKSFARIRTLFSFPCSAWECMLRCSASRFWYVLLFGLLLTSTSHGETSISIKNELEVLRHSITSSTGTLEMNLETDFEINDEHYFNIILFDEIQYSINETSFNKEEGKTRSTFEARDITLRGWGEQIDWIVGKQIVSWGNSDGLRILDTINPIYLEDFLKFDFTEMKKSLWMTNFKISGENSYAQLLLIPEHRSNESLETLNPRVGLQQNLNAQGINISDISQDEYDLGEKVSFGIELGTRLENDFELTLNFLQTYEQDAIIRAMTFQNKQPTLTLKETFPKKVMIGSSFNTQFLDWIFRGELGYFPDRYFNVLTQGKLSIERYNNLAFVVGADYSYNDWFFSVQYAMDRVLASPILLAREKLENVSTVTLSKQFLNETLKIGFKGLVSTNNQSGLVQPYVNYSISDRMSLRFLMSHYFGSEEDIFSSLSRDDFMRLGFQFEF